MQLQHLKKVTDQLLNGTHNKVHKAYNTVVGAFNTDSDKKWILDIDEPYTSNQQLMMILPPKSRQLFPREHVRLIDNELSEFYPRDFRLEVVDKAVDWMHTPIIPDIDDKIILEYVRN